MDRLVSKIFAGGISAGMFLIWWPQHVHAEDLTHLVVRGLLWTLTFELLLVSFGPLEDAVRRRVKARLELRRGLVRIKLDAVPAPARAGGTLALACMGLALPALLLAGGPTQLVEDDEPRVVKEVVVQRPVIEKKVVVRRVVEQAPLQSAGAAPSVAPTTAQAAPSTARAVPRKAATTKPKVVSEWATDTARTTTTETQSAQAETPAKATETPSAAATTTPVAPATTTAAPAADAAATTP